MVFLEISVVSLNNPLMSKKQLLEQISYRVKRTHQIEPKWIGDLENPKIRFEYDSKEHLEKCYVRDIFLFEKILELMNSGIISNEEIHQMNLKRKGHFPLIPMEIIDDQKPIYLILKYQTDYKEPLRNNYRLTLRVAEILEYSVEVEEIADGFLIFYKNPEDFEANQIDKANLTEMTQYFKEKGLLNSDLGKLLKKIYEVPE
jgi:hypothetical protein